jgi:hypothetical protein
VLKPEEPEPPATVLVDLPRAQLDDRPAAARRYNKLQNGRVRDRRGRALSHHGQLRVKGLNEGATRLRMVVFEEACHDLTVTHCLPAWFAAERDGKMVCVDETGQVVEDVEVAEFFTTDHPGAYNAWVVVCACKVETV